MALINCPECGKKISDKAESCPNCGCPIGNMYTDGYEEYGGEENLYDSYQEDIAEDYSNNEEGEMFECYKCGNALPIGADKCFYCGYVYSKNNFKSNSNKKSDASSTGKSFYEQIWFIVLACVILPPIGIVLIWINKKPRKVSSRNILTVILCFWTLVIFISGNKDGNKEDQSVETYKIVKNDSDQIDKSEDTRSEISNDTLDKDALEKTETVEQTPIEIFATDLLSSWSDYIGKKVTVSYACDRCEDDDQRIQSVYDEDAGLYLRSYVDNYRQFDYGEFITVTGIVDSKYAMYIEIKNAHIDSSGDNSKTIYEHEKAEYDEERRIKAEEYEAQFKANAESPTYDDLLRYPDTYKEKQIRVTVKIVRVEPDGIIFDGDIEATMSGETIALYDGREIKEPKLREGDSVTIYGYGKGTTTVKVQDVSGWLPKTVDRYDIPAIDIKYIEF